MSTRRAIFNERRISSVTVTSAHVQAPTRIARQHIYSLYMCICRLADFSHFGLLGELLGEQKGKVKASRTRYRALGPEQSARR